MLRLTPHSIVNEDRPTWAFAGSFSATRKAIIHAEDKLYSHRKKSLSEAYLDWYHQYDYECYMMENMVRDSYPNMGEENVASVMYEIWLSTPHLSAHAKENTVRTRRHDQNRL